MSKQLSKVINEKSQYYGNTYEVIEVMYTFKKIKKLYKLSVEGEFIVFDSSELEIL